jgi:L-arabonate dehydrase
MKNCGPKCYPGMAEVGMRGAYQRLYVERVLQADEDCDFDFLVGCRGSEVPRHSH